MGSSTAKRGRGTTRSVVEGATPSTEPASAPSVGASRRHLPRSAGEEPGTTVGSLHRELAARLERAFAAEGREGTAALDARLLLAHALGVDAASLALRDGEPVDAKAEALARASVERRVAGEPVARIVGTREFWGLELLLGPDTLVPRPDTETVVEAALDFLRRSALGNSDSNLPLEGRSKSASEVKPISGGGWRESQTPPRSGTELGHGRVQHPYLPKSGGPDLGATSTLPQGEGWRHAHLSLLDIGTGSGAILIALLSELPNATGVGTDIADGALAVAEQNAARIGVASRAEFIRSDWTGSVASGFDLVLSNPPYVESGAIAALPVEVGRHDPHVALDGGADGLDAYRAIFSDLGRILKEGGRAFLEIGHGQATDVAELAGKHGFGASFHRDLAGIERVAEIRRI